MNNHKNELFQGLGIDSLEKPSKEIERKFLIVSLPDNVEQYPHKEVIQGYIAITTDGTEVRLRQKADSYFQTVKSGAGKIRNEYEIEISKEQFDALWQATEGKRLSKTRYEIPHEGATIELDIYHGDLAGLVVAEVEFEHERDSDAFTPPSWFGEEATEDNEYKNQSLVLNGIPKK